MKKDEAQERPEAPGLPGAPAAGRTQELSRTEILAYLERTEEESPEPEPPTQKPGGGTR